MLDVDSYQHKQKVVQYQILKKIHLVNTIDYSKEIWEYNHVGNTNLNQRPLLGVQKLQRMFW
jgi:hypothetical protein